MNLRYFNVRIFYLVAIFLHTAQFVFSEDLIPKRCFMPLIGDKSPDVYWYPRSGEAIFDNGELKLMSVDNKSASYGLNIFDYNEIFASITVSFEAKTSGNGTASVSIEFRTKDGTQNNVFVIKDLKAENWQTFSQKIDLTSELVSAKILFEINGEKTILNVKNPSVLPEERKNSVDKKIRIQNNFCSGIYIMEELPPEDAFYDLKAAKILRRYLYEASGQILEIKKIPKSQEKLDEGMIVIGNAATRFDANAEKDFASLKPGAYMIAVDNGLVSLCGKSYGAVINGAYTLLEQAFGITFLTPVLTEPEIGRRDDIEFKKIKLSHSPALGFRFLRDGIEIGYSDWSCLADARLIGASHASTCHTASGLISIEKYAKSHPEYFAMQKDGKRLDSTARDLHICMGNKDVQKIVMDEVLEWMKACPEGKYFWVTPGDGGGKFCQCPECKAMDETEGNYTDRNLKFVNMIAEATSKVFPDKYLLTLAYVDIEKPPVRTTPHSNVIVMYCPYSPNWGNHLDAFDSKHNADGIASLNGWLNYAPNNIGIFDYPSCCREILHIWPSFYANYEKIIYYAKNNVKGLEFCGLYGHRYSYLGHGAFNELSRFVLGKVLWDPSLDVEKEIDRFMEMYYGPSASQMRKLFTLAHQEVKTRGYFQHTEEVKRGFVTKAFADKAYAIFADAEVAVAGNQKYLNRVLKEKVYFLYSDLYDRSRSSGKIPDDEIPAYAQRLSEFASLCKKFGVDYFGMVSPQEWFWNTALLRVKNNRWLTDPIIESLIQKPLESIGESVPRCQEKIKDGFLIPSIGIAGAEDIKIYAHMCQKRDNVKVLRRPSSGKGYAMTYLYLDEEPGDIMRLEIEGQDNDKTEKALMCVKINKKVIYEGETSLTKKDWGWMSINIPSKLLQKGKNLIEFENITPDIEKDEEKINIIIEGRKNYYWGWYIISGLKIIGE